MSNHQQPSGPPTTLAELLYTLGSGSLREHRQPNVELKESWAQAHGPKLSALANKVDGLPKWLVVGVSDNGVPVGRNEAWVRHTEQVLSQQINDSLNPVQACMRIDCCEASGSWIVVVRVQNPGDVVYWGDRAYQAAGTTAKEMGPEEILALRIQLPGLSDFSKQSVSAGSLGTQLLERFAERIRQKATTIEGGGVDLRDATLVLQKLGIKGTQAERILFGDCRYRLIRYQADGEPLSNESLSGTYRILTDTFIDETQQWAQRELGTSEAPYPSRALREAFANAVAHAAYFESDGDIIIEQYPDRISIGNLCVRESTYFANRWFSRSHRTVNGFLMEVLRIASHVDELGRGKHLIFSESIRNGKKPPLVVVEKTGRYDRWKLSLFGGTQDAKLLRLLKRCRAIYKDEEKALIAQALVLWRDRPVSEIRDFIDGDFSRQFAEVLTGLEGPIFYYRERDCIVLRRWAQILIGEGKDSKAFSPAEENNLLDWARDFRTKYYEGYITPSDLRKLAAMADTPSEKSLSSMILTKWHKQGVLKRVRRGQYQFVPKQAEPLPTIPEILELLKREDGDQKEPAKPN